MATGCRKDDLQIDDEIITEPPTHSIESCHMVVKLVNEFGENVKGITANFNHQYKIINEDSYFYFKGENINKFNELIELSDDAGLIFQFKLANIENEVNYHELTIVQNRYSSTFLGDKIQEIDVKNGLSLHIQPNQFVQNGMPYVHQVRVDFQNNTNENGLVVNALPIVEYYEDGQLFTIEPLQAMEVTFSDSDQGLLGFAKPLLVENTYSYPQGTYLYYFDNASNSFNRKQDISNKKSFNIAQNGLYLIGKKHRAAYISGAVHIRSHGYQNANFLIDGKPIAKYGSTNNGKYQLAVPLNETFKLEVYDPCGNPFMIYNGMIDKDTDLGIKVIENDDVLKSTITTELVGCTSELLSGGFIHLQQQQDNTLLYYPEAQVEAPVFYCLQKGELKLSFADQKAISITPDYIIKEASDYDFQKSFLCQGYDDAYLIVEGQNDKELYSKFSAEVIGNILHLKDESISSSIDLKFNLSNNACNLVFESETLDGKGVSINCASASDCGFQDVGIIYDDRQKSGWIKGYCFGRLWGKSLHPVSADYFDLKIYFQFKI